MEVLGGCQPETAGEVLLGCTNTSLVFSLLAQVSIEEGGHLSVSSNEPCRCMSNHRVTIPNFDDKYYAVVLRIFIVSFTYFSVLCPSTQSPSCNMEKSP